MTKPERKAVYLTLILVCTGFNIAYTAETVADYVVVLGVGFATGWICTVKRKWLANHWGFS